MRKIVIIDGVYGHRPGGGRYVSPKRAGDPPFDVEAEKAEELVFQGIAEYADEIITQTEPERVATEPSEEQKPVSDNTPEDNETPEGELSEETEESLLEEEDDDEETDEEIHFERPEYNAEMGIEKLREIMSEHGLTFKVGMSKKDIVENLDAYFDNFEDDMPDMSDGDIVP